MDEVIKWSGWLIAVTMIAWKIVETRRNRSVIKFFIGMSTDENLIYFTVINTGHRPVNLIRAGVQFADGFRKDMPQSSGMYFGWLYNMQSKTNHLDLTVIKNFVQKLVIESDNQAVPKSIYYTADDGHNYGIKIPDNIKNVLLN